MTLKTRLLSASALNLADYALKIGVVLVVSPFLIKHLGKQDYGLWVLLLSIIGYLDLLDLGFNQTAVRYLSRTLAPDQQAAHAATFAWFKALYRRLGAAAFLLTLGAVSTLPWWLPDPAQLHRVLPILGLGGLMMSATFALRANAILIKSHVLYHQLIIAGLVRLTVYTSLMVISLSQGGGLVFMALSWVAGLALEQTILWRLARPLVPPTCPDTTLPPERTREIRGFAAKTFGGVAAGFMRDRVDTQVLASQLGTIAVTHYSVGSRLIIMFSDVINALFGGHFLAAFSRIQAEDGAAAARERLLATLRFSAPVALAGGVLLFLLGPPFIDCWLGLGFEESHRVVQILALPSALVLMLYPAGPYLGSMNRHGTLAAFSLAGGALNLAASLLLVRWLGFTGPVIATAGELLLTGLVLWPWLITRHGDIPISTLFRLLTRAFLSLLPVAAIAGSLLHAWGPPRSFPSLALSFLLLLLMLACAIWFLAFDAPTRARLAASLGRAPRPTDPHPL